MIEKESLALLTVLPAAHTDELWQSIGAWGMAAWRLDGSSATSSAGLFAAATGLPSPFRGRAAGDWDAFGDNLWQLVGLADGPECAFVWEHADVLLAASVGDFVEAVVALSSVARKVANPASPGAVPKLLYLFVVGDGPNFGTSDR